MNKKKIIVFGATGNVGSYFVDYALKFFDANEYELIASGRKNTDFFDRYGIKYFSVDISKKEDFDKLPTENISSVIFLSGVLPAYKTDSDPRKYFEINTIGGLNVLEFCRVNKVEKFIYTQTFADLAGYLNKELVLKSDMPRNLVYKGDHTIYAISKCAVVDLARHYYEEYNLKAYIFRLPNIYMYTRDDTFRVNGVLKKVAYRHIMDQAILGNDIEVWGNPMVKKDIVYVADFCQMLCKSILSDIDYGIYNVGTGIGTTMEQQIKDIIDIFCPADKKSKMVYCPEKASSPEYIMDVSNAKKDFGYEPVFDHKKYLIEFKKEMELKRFKDLENGKYE